MIPATHTIMVDGVRRTFLLAEPAGAASAIVLSLHGTRSSAPGQARLTHMATLAEREGAVVAFPQAIVPVGSGFEWDLDGDLSYLCQLVDVLRNRYATSSDRVSMAGMSGGARMSCHFAQVRPETLSMVGAVAGLRAPGDPPPSRAVAILAFHGTADRINPYDGGHTDRWKESVPEAARRWAVANGLPAKPIDLTMSPALTRSTYGREGQPGEVTLWTARGAGHTWPGARVGFFLRLLLGRTTTEIDATAKIWSFAQGHAAEL